MHKFPKLKWFAQDLGVSIRPNGFRGWFIIRNIIPYLPGDVLCFTLFADKTKTGERKFNYYWVLLQHFPDGKEAQVQVYDGSFTSSSRQEVKEPSGSVRIITPGQYTLLLTIQTDDETESERQTMAFISALPGGRVLWAIYTLIIALITALITRFLFD